MAHHATPHGAAFVSRESILVVSTVSSGRCEPRSAPSYDGSASHPSCATGETTSPYATSRGLMDGRAKNADAPDRTAIPGHVGRPSPCACPRTFEVTSRPWCCVHDGRPAEVRTTGVRPTRARENRGPSADRDPGTVADDSLCLLPWLWRQIVFKTTFTWRPGNGHGQRAAVDQAVGLARLVIAAGGVPPGWKLVAPVL